ncbi:Aminoacyl-tRNA synthetase class I anticodon-binding domain subdomain 2 [Penicillium fimorum]|uniref:Glutamate--tRNA ligase, mitochondrial n=1 Tax=Penicillium fimorum TaxID=1882269 RepID=A0A9X0C429_9EURO|nr:Aminoacyl-tRNA synthetase class I anticodon-binding domain subdomain 2 [Penicillium fimorum]
MKSPQGIFARRSWSCIQYRPFSSSLATRAPNSKNKLPNGPARTRFAPSPTGYLHLGSLRTALFNYLLAKRTGGQFLLRIEDTDQKRTIPGAEQRLYDDLQWAGLNWDEGPIVGGPYGPYRQSERTALYQSHANDLISNGHAYRCFCSAERLDSIARHRSQAGLPPGYDRKCGDVSAEESEDRAAKGEAHIIRLKVDEYPMFNDLVYGKSGQNRPNNSKLDFIDRVYNDPVLIKSDGHPTYHLANVVDDHCMKITHVIRGTEWMASTPMHMALYDAFKWTPPSFAHVPLLVDRNGQKLSKRNADIDLSSFKDQQGIFPATLVNFASLLGWSHSEKSDVLSLKELERIFNLKITRGNTVVSFEKLQFLQKAHIQRLKVTSVVEESYPLDKLTTILKGRTISEYIAPLIRADVNSYTDAKEFAQRNSVFFTPKLDRAPYKPVSPQSSPEVPIQALHTAAAALTLVPSALWNIETHRDNINSYNGAESIIISASESDTPVDSKNAGKLFKKELYHYLRWALSASAPGPGISETMVVLGRDETLRRVQDAKALTQSLVPSAGQRVPKGTLPEDQSWMGSLATNR